MGGMTIDTATLRAQWEAIREQQGPEAFAMIAHVGDGIALLDALEAERERVRVLTEALRPFAELHGDLLSNPRYLDDYPLYWMPGQEPCSTVWITLGDVRHAAKVIALATAGGEGATT